MSDENEGEVYARNVMAREAQRREKIKQKVIAHGHRYLLGEVEPEAKQQAGLNKRYLKATIQSVALHNRLDQEEQCWRALRLERQKGTGHGEGGQGGGGALAEAGVGAAREYWALKKARAMRERDERDLNEVKGCISGGFGLRSGKRARADDKNESIADNSADDNSIIAIINDDTSRDDDGEDPKKKRSSNKKKKKRKREKKGKKSSTTSKTKKEGKLKKKRTKREKKKKDKKDRDNFGKEEGKCKEREDGGNASSSSFSTNGSPLLRIHIKHERETSPRYHRRQGDDNASSGSDSSDSSSSCATEEGDKRET